MAFLKDKWMREFITEITMLTPEEFLGVLTVCGIKPYTVEEVEVEENSGEKSKNKERRAVEKEFDVLLEELFNKVEGYNRTQRRNLMTIIKSANKGRKKKWNKK